MKNRWLATLLLASVGMSSWGAATHSIDALTLEQALELAERQHPQLAEAHALVEAAAGRAQQAGTLPNPELIVGAQQLPLDRGASNQREFVAGVSQLIPLGGKLGKAREAELLEREVRLRGLEVARHNLRRRVHGAFATALYQQRASLTQRQLARSTEQAVAIARARVEAGDALAEDLARVEIESARAKLEAQRSESLHQQALLGLVAALGDTTLSVGTVTGDLDTTLEIPTLESLVATLSLQPELALADARQRAGEARVDLAQAERIPEVRVEVLYRRLDGFRENTFDLGLSIPLPVFNRNQGRLREARAEAAAAEARSRMSRHALNVQLRESHAQLMAAIDTARALQREILPRVETVLKSAEARLAAGDASLADVLPVRRDWAALQLSHLESLRDVMQAWAEMSSYLKTP